MLSSPHVLRVPYVGINGGNPRPYNTRLSYPAFIPTQYSAEQGIAQILSMGTVDIGLGQLEICRSCRTCIVYIVCISCSTSTGSKVCYNSVNKFLNYQRR